MKRRKRKSGFTLMEVLLVMAILVVMASMVTFAFLTIQRNAMRDSAFNQAVTLAQACDQYKLNVGFYPQKLDDLKVKPQGLTDQKWKGPYLQQPLPLDPWGQAYKYQPDDANNVVFITSAGPDRQEGTQDDVSNIQNQNQ
jgi:general secretion pathway protein G